MGKKKKLNIDIIQFKLLLMFYLASLLKTIEIYPINLDASFTKIIEREVFDEIEGKCDHKLGCIVSIYSYKPHEGKIQYGKGTVIFEVIIQCIVCLPKIGEVIDVVVNEILPNVVIASAGPIKIIINNKNFGSEEILTNDFIDGVRGLISKNHEIKIMPGIELRVKILNCRKTMANNQETLICIATINDEYLGVISE